jgi:hypothetical protein
MIGANDMDFYTEQERGKMDALKDDNIRVDWLAGIQPVQADGWIDDYPFFFHGIGDWLKISIAKNKSDNLDDAVDDSIEQFNLEQEYFNAGQMSFMDVLEFIEKCAQAFRAGRPL